MNFKIRQSEMDNEKWFDSILAGEDLCGSYDFCSKCRKEEKYPCARAENRWKNGYIRVAEVTRVK